MSVSSDPLWVVPLNDLEAHEILHLLDFCHQRVFITHQPWGASWQNLEGIITGALESLPAATQVIGVELQGPARPGAVNIDHHKYRDDDRYCAQSSLEQVAAIVGAPLSRWQLLAAINDRHYIGGMRAEMPDARPDEIAAIRRADRRAQGVTIEEDRLAREDLTRIEVTGRFGMLTLDRRPTSAHFDFLFLDFALDAVLVQSPTIWQYSGRGASQFWPAPGQARYPENHWAGGHPENGFFCIERPSVESQRRILDTFERCRAGQN